MSWISVKDQLPEIMDRGIEKNPASDEVFVSDGFRISVGIRWIYGERDYFLPNDRESFDDITHWMPLPQTPKE